VVQEQPAGFDRYIFSHCANERAVDEEVNAIRVPVCAVFVEGCGRVEPKRLLGEGAGFGGVEAGGGGCVGVDDEVDGAGGGCYLAGEELDVDFAGVVVVLGTLS
jgi:hypothetical protein